MDYGIYLSFNNEEEGFQIPVNPESYEVIKNGQGKTYDITGLGEINVIKNPKLTGIGFKSEFPAQWYPAVVVERLQEPLFYINLIKKWMESLRPIRFVLTGSTVDINMLVSIEKFNWKESGGAVGDIEYEITFKKYVPYAAKKVLVQQTVQTAEKKTLSVQSEAPKRPDERIPPKTYKLVAGDTLWKVAQKLLGNGARYKEIQKLNNISDAQLTKLRIGMEIKLP